MLNRRPLAVIVGACLLQACTTPPARQANRIEPVYTINHAAGSDADAFLRLGKYHQTHGNLDLARKAYVQSMALDRRQPDAPTALAALDSQEGRLEEAKLLMQKVVADFPSQTHPWNNLGYVHYLQGNFSLAVTTLERAVALDGRNERARNNLKIAQAAASKDVELAKTTQSVAKDMPAASTTPVSKPSGNPISGTAPASRMGIVQLSPQVFELKYLSAMPQLPIQPAPLPLFAAQNRSATGLNTPSSPDADTAAALRLSRLEIANGNGVPGMAMRISKKLGKEGIATARLTNLPRFDKQVTEIQYRAGYEQQALLLKKAMNYKNVVMRVATLIDAADVRLVLGKDATNRMASIESDTESLDGGV